MSQDPSHRVEITSTLKFSRDRRCRDRYDRDYNPYSKAAFSAATHTKSLFFLRLNDR